MSEVTKFFEQRIEEWLQAEMAKDELFRKTVESKPEKSVKEACNYVLMVAKETKQAGWDDSEVYGLVRHYYDEDDIEDIEEQHPSKIIVSGHVDLTEQEKAEAMEQAKNEYYAELRRHAEAKEEAHRKLRKQRKAEAETQQLDLFGGL